MLEQLIILWVCFLVLHAVINGRFFLWELVSVIPSFVFLLVPILLSILSFAGGLPEGARALALVGILLGLPHVDLGARRPGKSAQDTIKLFNWNTEFWDTKWEKGSQFIDYLLEQDADVYHLQETIYSDSGLKKYLDVKNELAKNFPGYAVIQTGEVVTLTRLKVIKHQVIEHHILRVDVEWQGEVLSLYNLKIRVHMLLHLLPKEPITFLRDVKRRFYQRRKEYYALTHSLEHNKNHIVMSGDFNTSKVQRPIKRLLMTYKDAFFACHFGIPVTYTFGQIFKLWRIDYVLGKRVSFLSYRNFDAGKISDHDALSVEFSLS